MLRYPRNATVSPTRSTLKTITLLAIFATLAFILVTGGGIIWPTNIAWLQRDDLTIHYLGWLFFKDSPWTWPLGANPGYGLELSSSIVFSDSIPIFAFLFKTISNYLPNSFQYFGIWAFSCFLLQTFMAWKLVGIITESPMRKFLGVAFFLFAPPFLWRFKSGHYALGAHWLILAGLFLNLTPTKLPRFFLWPLLLSLSTLIHAYIFVMVGALWFPDIGKRIINRTEKLKYLSVEFTLTCVTVAICLWGAGYFMIEEMRQPEGFGFYRMNLLSLFDSDGWSYFLPDIKGKAGDYEGFNFLGSGSILLALAALPNITKVSRHAKSYYQWIPLLCSLSILTALAISNNIGLGPYNICTFSTPDLLSQITGTFRSSGRMFWPVYYTLLWITLLLFLKNENTRLNLLILLIALTTQIVDNSAGWITTRQSNIANTGTSWQTPLKNHFWEEIKQHYAKIRIIPTGYNKPNSKIFAYFAAKNKMQTDAAQSARADMAKLSIAVKQAKKSIHNGVFQKDSLYILDDKYTKLAKSSHNQKHDFLTIIDGFNLLAPNWFTKTKQEKE